jgi:hypothetical protein
VELVKRTPRHVLIYHGALLEILVISFLKRISEEPTHILTGNVLGFRNVDGDCDLTEYKI